MTKGQRRPNLDLALVGNCSYGALIDRRGRVVWCCLPHFDRDPTFSSLLAGDDATEGFFEIAGVLGLTARERHWREHADHIRAGVLEKAWNEEKKSFVSAFGGGDVEASLLLMPHIGFIQPDDPRYVATVERELQHGDYIYRYVHADDFGQPETAFTVCTFWYIEALASIGCRDEARALFERLLARRNHVGLPSEDLDITTGELWGNFPQTYSMVGLIRAATHLSRPWEGAF